MKEMGPNLGFPMPGQCCLVPHYRLALSIPAPVLAAALSSKWAAERWEQEPGPAPEAFARGWGGCSVPPVPPGPAPSLHNPLPIT